VKLLLHICCAPCSIYPLKKLREQSAQVMGYYYRSNIHPFSECLRRQKTLQEYCDHLGVPLIIDKAYNLEEFLQSVVFRETERCRFCYHDRLQSAARIARRGRFDAFSTTLLYSKFQKHDLIRSIAAGIAREVGIPFYYCDFREGWKEGIAESKRLAMYRQPYCGCIFSEKERFYTQPLHNDQDSNTDAF
jgi:epoxyqueuosine reductase